MTDRVLAIQENGARRRGTTPPTSRRVPGESCGYGRQYQNFFK